jgi:hypothetical protein
MSPVKVSSPVLTLGRRDGRRSASCRSTSHGVPMLARSSILVTAAALALAALSGCTVAPVSRAPAAAGYAEQPSARGADQQCGFYEV